MKRLALALAASCALMLGAAGTVSAQVGEPNVEIDNEQPTAGDTINITVSGAEPEAAGSVTLGDQTAEFVVDADGNGAASVTVPDSPGDLDGIVTIGGREIPFSVAIQAAADSGDGGDGDGSGSDGSGGDAGSGSNALPETGPADSGFIAAVAATLLLAGVALIVSARRRQPAA